MESELNINEPEMESNSELNTFEIVHIHNCSKQYHLTRQTLIDSSIIQNTHTFFYHILSLFVDEFNEQYTSFAYLSVRSNAEADIYLNVDEQALDYIIRYIQTNKIDLIKIHKNSELFNEVNDLASIFGMSYLVERIKTVVIPDSNIERSYKNLRMFAMSLLRILNTNYNLSLTEQDIAEICTVNKNTENIIKQFIVSCYYYDYSSIMNFLLILGMRKIDNTN